MRNYGYKTHIRLTKDLSVVLSKWIGCQRFIYNAKVEESNYFFKFKKHQLDLTGFHISIDQQYSQFKTDITPWLNEIPSQILRNGVYKYMMANKRFLNKLSGKPKKQKKSIKESVMITNELFRFDDTHKLILGTQNKPIGTIKLNKKTRLILQQYNKPKTIYISRKAGSWYLSFTYETNEIQQTEQELLDYIQQHTIEELQSKTIGIDRGVKVNAYLSNGDTFEYGNKLEGDLNILQNKIKSAQRKLSKKEKYSKNYNKQKLKLQKLHKQVKNKRTNFNHHASKAIVSGGNLIEEGTVKYMPHIRLDKILLIGFENLKLKNMTKSSKGSIEKPGKNVKQKSGLNKAILHNNLGQIKLFSKYKALKEGILVVDVNPKCSSQECHQCGFVHAENRKDSLFSCLNCKYIGNADFNASCVIKKRAIDTVLENYTVKKSKKMGFRRKVGLEQSNSLPVETLLDIVGINISVKGNTYSAEVVEAGSSVL